MGTDGSGPAEMSLYVYDVAAALWSSALWTDAPALNSGSDTWYSQTVDLSDYDGKSVQIWFTLNSRGWASDGALDNIEVTVVPTCGSSFTDTGGALGNYSSSEDYTTTIAPTTSGDLVTVTFSAFATESGYDYLYVYDGEDTSAALLGTYSGSSIPGPFTSTHSSGKLTFRFTSDSSVNDSGWEAAVTCAAPPSCQDPTSMAATNITATSADLTWTASATGETAWEVILKTDSGAPAATTAGTGTATTDNTAYTYSGLTANTLYYVYYRAACTVGSDYSVWVAGSTVTTLCSAVTSFPYTEDFDAAASLPSCWGQSSTNTEDWLFGSSATYGASSDHTSGSGNFAWIDDSAPHTTSPSGLETPSLDLTALTAPRLKFWFQNGTGTPSSLYIDVYDGSTWTTDVLSIATTNVSTWTEYIVDITAYKSSSTIIKFSGVEDASGYQSDISLDDITVEETPSCQVPTTLTAANITATSADLGWTAGASETAWEIVVQADGTGTPAGSGTAVATTAAYSATGLTASTDYEIYYRADCTGGDYSAWVGPVDFTTLCAAVSIDSLEDFSTMPANCWSEAVGVFGTPTGTASLWGQADFGYDAAHANGKAARVNIYGSSIDEYLISNEFDLSSGTYYLNYEVALTNYNSTGPAVSGALGADDYVAVLVTQDGGTSWQELYRWDASSTISNTGQSAAEIALSGYGVSVKFAFYAFSDTSNEDNDFYVDNFQVTSSTLSVEGTVIEGFSLYPNPVNDRLHLTALDNIDELSVYNLLGQEVLRTQPKVLNTQVDMSNLPTGMYVVKVKVGQQLGSYRIVKE